MDKKHDILDDVLDIQEEWDKVKNPIESLAQAFSFSPEHPAVFNPSDFKARPMGNAYSCIAALTRDEMACTKCLDVCPVDAITIQDHAIVVSDHCRKCGLCSSVCPTEALTDPLCQSTDLRKRIEAAALTHERCYITCTRALRRLPKENEVLLACVGAVSWEVWASLLADFDNLYVYLPYGICDRCRTTTGEAVYMEQIARAEAISEAALDLEMDSDQLTDTKNRDWRRKEFVKSLISKGSLKVTSPTLAKCLQAYEQDIRSIQESLDQAFGQLTSQKERRKLPQNRAVLLSTLQNHPELAHNIDFELPCFDPDLCTLCHECVHACPTHACELDAKGHFIVEPTYCVSCGACERVCPTGALTMQTADPRLLVVPKR